MASEDNTFRPEASFQTVSELLSQLTETWKKSEEYLLQKVTDSAYKLIKKEMDYEALRKKQNEIDKHTESLKKKIEGLEDELKKKVNDFDEMKKVNDQYTKKIRAYEKIILDYDVKVSSLEKLGNELMGSGCSSVDLEVKKQKDVAAERSRLPPPPGFEEIIPKPKKITESKLLEIIKMEDDDEDDHDLINICTSKRKCV